MTWTPRLMLVTNRLATQLPLLDAIRSAVRGGVDAVQVREKDLSFEDLRDLTAQIVEAAAPAPVFVNGSIDVARLLGVGIHFPEHGASVAAARAALGSDVLIGQSVHSVDSARAILGADYLVAGHVFDTSSKPDLPAIGLDGLKAIVAAANAPVIAIGGIDQRNARSVISAGATGVAIMSSINQSEDPAVTASAIASELDGIPITLNGHETIIAPNLTIDDFLNQRGFKDRLVVVEINAKIAAKSSYSVRVFKPEDSVEIVHFVGGG